jgi:hypothetical protein
MQEYPMNPTDQTSAYNANFTCVAIALLVNCLKAQGVLGAHEYEDALRATISQDDAPLERLDYRYLSNLLKLLEHRVPGQTPLLSPLH